MIRVIEARLIVFIIGIVHFASGCGMLYVPSISFITSLYLLTAGLHQIGLDGHAYVVVSITLIISGLLAVSAIVLSRSLSLAIRIKMIWPQQILQIVQFVSICLPALSGVYPDGHVPSGGGAFIFFDQLGLLLLSIYHTLWMMLAIVRLERERDE